jgi:hypothetical protein
MPANGDTETSRARPCGDEHSSAGVVDPLKSASALVTVAFVLGVGGCADGTARDAKDAQIQRTIIGTWWMETNRVDGVMTFHPDGSFSGYWSNTVAPRGWRSEGEWWITNGDCSMLITSKSAWNYTLTGPTGTVDHMRILSLDDQRMIVADYDQTNTWTRRR